MFWVEGNVIHSRCEKGHRGRGAGETQWDCTTLEREAGIRAVAAVIKPLVFLLRAMENLFKQETYRIRSVFLKHHPVAEWKGPE